MTRHQWLLIVAIAAGLVGMHHLVHEPTAHMTPIATVSATHNAQADPDLAGANPVEMPRPSRCRGWLLNERDHPR